MTGKKTIFLVISVFMTFVLIGCAPQQEVAEESEWDDFPGPDWARKIPEEEGVIFGIGNAESRRLNIALQRANLRASNDIAQKINMSIRSWEEDYIQEMGDAADGEILEAYESLTERVVDEELHGIREAERAVRQENGVYNVWVKVKLDYDEVANQFSEMERLETEYGRERARDRFDESLREVED